MLTFSLLLRQSDVLPVCSSMPILSDSSGTELQERFYSDPEKVDSSTYFLSSYLYESSASLSVSMCMDQWESWGDGKVEVPVVGHFVDNAPLKFIYELKPL